MDQNNWLAERFEENRATLRAVAYRMLGSLSEADDAVQEAWIRLTRTDSSQVENLGAWLTTIVARVCLNMLRARGSRREDLTGAQIPDPIVVLEDEVDPEHQALLADAVGLALLVVLETLTPAERLAFVLHDMFKVPFDDIAPIVERSPEATRQLASRARRRVKATSLVPDSDLSRQREAIDAFFAAARGGDFDALIAVLDPDVVLRSDTLVIRSAATVAKGAVMFADPARRVHPALVNGAAGAIITIDGRPVSVVGFTIVEGRILAMDSIDDPDRLSRLGLPELVD